MAPSQRSEGDRDFWMCECNEKQLGAVEYACDNNNYCEVSVKLDRTERTELTFVMIKVPTVS